MELFLFGMLPPLVLLWVIAYEVYKIRWLLEAMRKREASRWGPPPVADH